MDDLVVGDLIIPAGDLEERFDTPGGPGGQHANRTASAVTLRFDIAASSLDQDVIELLTGKLGSATEVRVSDSRSQARNRATARSRLAARIAEALEVPEERRPTRPTRAARQRRLDEKRRRGEVKRSRTRPNDQE